MDFARLANPILRAMDAPPDQAGESPEEVVEVGILRDAPEELQLTKFRTQDIPESKTTDSNMALPIILMVGLVFLMSR